MVIWSRGLKRLHTPNSTRDFLMKWDFAKIIIYFRRNLVRVQRIEFVTNLLICRFEDPLEILNHIFPYFSSPMHPNLLISQKCPNIIPLVSDHNRHVEESSLPVSFRQHNSLEFCLYISSCLSQISTSSRCTKASMSKFISVGT